MTFLMLILGLLMLLAGGTGLVKGASDIASRYGISPLIVGLTVVAFGTSAPELVVSAVGAARGETELAFGNVTGSNIANIGLVLATAAIFRPLTIEGQIVRRELPLLLLGTAVLLIMVLDMPLNGLDPVISRSDGLILLLIFSIFVYLTISDFMFPQREDPLMHKVLEMEESLPKTASTGALMHWLFIIVGICALTVGGQITITYGAQFAELMGLQPVVVGMLIVAIGTSLPEFVTSVIAALRNESDLCLGNVVGSNIFNGLVVLPIAALIRPLPVPQGGLLDVAMSLAFAAVIIVVFFVGRAHMSRGLGVMMLLAYLAYMVNRTLF